MRTGACTVQQALTAEAATVLKHSLNLAKRRGNAQVTPLHVAATLLSSIREPSTTLFRKACLRSHPLHPSSHPLHCRALELCFNVALNRLPTTPPPSSGPLVPSQPSLSNALIAALKRAQAHQRRGCIEQQQQQHQQQQPLLAIKVEVEQLIISILDDPSVSRVMREAGFSSTFVKSNLEESASSFSLPSASFFDSHREVIIKHASFWQTQLLKPPSNQNLPLATSSGEDLKAVIDGLVKGRTSSNTVIVGDSVSYCEGLVAELMGKVERGDVPEELRSTQFIRFHLSPVQIKFMCMSDVEMKISDLRRKVGSLALERKNVIIYLGDLRWAASDEVGEGYKPVDHALAEVGRLQSEWRSCGIGGNTSSKVWLMATASYQTHMRCQMRQPSLETQWGLHAVLVPSGGLTLSLNVPSNNQESSRVRSSLGSGFQTMESKPTSSLGHVHEKLTCCVECASNFEKEASPISTGKNIDGSPNLPFWLQPQLLNHREDMLDELRRKWKRICQSLHQNMKMRPTFFGHRFDGKILTEGSSYLRCSFTEPSSISIAELAHRRHSTGDSSFPTDLRYENGNTEERKELKQWFLGGDGLQETRTDLSLSHLPFSDCATSKDRIRESAFEMAKLQRTLKENMPWQSEITSSIADAMLEQSSSAKGFWFLFQGTDRIGMRRLPRVLSEFFGNSANGIISIDARKSEGDVNSKAEKIIDALRKKADCVVSIEGINCADDYFLRFLSEGTKTGFLSDTSGGMVSSANAIFVLSTKSTDDASESAQCPIKMKIRVRDERIDCPVPNDLKRKAEFELPSKSKSPRKVERLPTLDLNLCTDEEENDSCDLTHEEGSQEFGIEKILNSVPSFTLDAGSGRAHPIFEHFVSRLLASSEVVGRNGRLIVEDAAVAELVDAAGFFTENLFEKWLSDVFQTCLATLGKGGNVRISVEGRQGNVMECGFQGSVLPNRVSEA